jgi:hypothetical protein
MENNKKVKKCKVCEIELTVENQVTGRNFCKPCHNKKSHDYYVAKLQPIAIAKQEAKVNQVKKCYDCLCVLTDENQVKGRNQCRDCRSAKYKEYSQTKLSDKYSIFDGTKKCSACDKVLNLDNCVKNRPICKNCYNAKTNDYKKNNKEKVLQSHKEYHQANKEKIAEYYKGHYKDNKDTYLKNNQKWRSENREHTRKKENERFRQNPTLRLKRNCRTRIWDALNGKYRKTHHTIEYVDCDVEFLKKWLEYNFEDGMTFDNYGPYWHVDHVIPCAKFDLTDPNEIAHCFHWVNLKPMKGSENMSKHADIDNIEILSHYQTVEVFAVENNIEIPDFDFEKYFEINDNEIEL